MNYTDEESIHPIRRKGFWMAIAFIAVVIGSLYGSIFLMIYLISKA